MNELMKNFNESRNALLIHFGFDALGLRYHIVDRTEYKWSKVGEHLRLFMNERDEYGATLRIKDNICLRSRELTLIVVEDVGSKWCMSIFDNSKEIRNEQQLDNDHG